MGQIDPLREVVKSRLRSHFIWKESGTGFNYLRNNWTIHYIEEEMESRVHSRLSRKQSRIAYFLFSKLFFYIKCAWILPRVCLFVSRVGFCHCLIDMWIFAVLAIFVNLLCELPFGGMVQRPGPWAILQDHWWILPQLSFVKILI